MKKITYGIIALILLITGLFFLKLFENNPDVITGQAVSGLQEANNYEPDELVENTTGSLQETENFNATDNSNPQERYDVETCNADNCNPPGICYQDRCKIPECTKDSDCKDEDGCTPEVCEFAGHPNAFCSIEVISRLKNNDGCCPLGANADTDTDCAPVCGNHKCEYGETTSACEADCKNAGPGPAPEEPPSEPPSNPE